MKTCKVRVKLTSEQERFCWQYSFVARNYWNLLVEIDNRNNHGEFDLGEKDTFYSKTYERDIYKLDVSDYMSLAKEIAMKDKEKYYWYFGDNLSFIFSAVARELVAVKKRNLKLHGRAKLRFRSYLDTTPSFPIRCDSYQQRLSRIYLKDLNRLQIPTLGVVGLGGYDKNIDLDCKKQTASLLFDGKYWYLTFTYKPLAIQRNILGEQTEPVGIDLGVRKYAYVSNGLVFPNIATYRRYKLYEKRLKRLSRKLSRKYQINGCNKYNKTKNIKKLERQIRLLHRKIVNLRMNHIREMVIQIVKKNPMYVAMEDLDVKGMLKDKHKAHDISNCAFYMTRMWMIHKCQEYGIEFRLVDRWYPSSKNCSSCGSYKRDLGDKEIYCCNECNIEIDRDYNASLNILRTDRYERIV